MQRSLITATALLALGAVGAVAVMALPVRNALSAQTQITAAQTATFTVQNMTCALCPITVKQAMQGVPGVKSVDIDFTAKTAAVVFDPATAGVAAIAAAATAAGYPATVQDAARGRE